MTSPDRTDMLYLESLRAGLAAAMDACEEVLVVGEDVVDPYGGAFKVTQGLSTRFPGRVIATPISEAGLVGLSTGLALRGFRPVAEIMFGDFLTLAADQLINSAAKFPLMYRDRVQVPMVVRTPMGGGRGYGPTHSQSLEKHFLGVPGLDVLSPSPAHDPGRMLGRCIREAVRPVLFIEYKNLYPARLVGDGDPLLRRRVADDEATGETVVVDNFGEGPPDTVVFAYGGAAGMLFNLMRRLVPEEIRVRAIVPGRLHQPPDPTRLRAQLPDGVPVLFAECGTRGFDWGAEMVASLFAAGLLRDSTRVHRIASAEDVVPAGQVLEDRMHLSEAGLERAILEALA